MSFDVGADLYDRFMGRYSVRLASPFAELAGVEPGQRVLDVGCGPGALTAELVLRVGAAGVAAVDPSGSFVESARERHPGAAVQRANAESLPFHDAAFDAALAQLVVQFMEDPGSGIAEMRRVTRPGGVVAACIWDHDAGGGGPLSVFWDAAKTLDPAVTDESGAVGAQRGQLSQLLLGAGLSEVDETELTAMVEHPTFEDWWEPFTLGVGTAGAYVATLDEDRVAALRERCRELLPPAPFTVAARAWAARGIV